jgi:hypothetical protein
MEETNLQKKIIQLENRINELESRYIYITANIKKKQSDQSIEVVVPAWNGKIHKLENFFNLKKIIFVNNQLSLHYIPEILYCPSVIEITFRYEQNIFSKHNPKAQLNVKNNFPNLSKVTVENFYHYDLFLDFFDFLIENKITHVVFKNCRNIQKIISIQKHFAKNNYILEMIE